MTPAYHNGESFHYIVKYRRLSAPLEDVKIVKIDRWRRKELVVENQPTFTRYEISVAAGNSVGTASEDQLDTFIGFSGEDGNLTFSQNASTEVLLKVTKVLTNSTRKIESQI